MATKPKTKKELPPKSTEIEEKKVVEDTVKKDTSSEKEDSLTKKEIKELVEETVDEALNEQNTKQSEATEEKTAETDKTEDLSSDKKPLDEGTAEESNETDTLHTEESDNREEHQESITPSSSSGEMPVETLTAESPTDATKTEVSSADAVTSPAASTTPVISVSGIASSGGSGLGTTPSDKAQNKKTPLILLFIVFLICGFVVGISILFILSKNNFKLPTVPFVNTVIATPTPLATNTPTPQVASIATYKIKVLNGSGVAGAAAQVKDDLTTAGFTVESIGNSPDNVTETTVAAKSTVDQATLSKLFQTLETKYTVSSQTSSLPASESVDIVVTISKAK